jgi:hypothetical protein
MIPRLIKLHVSVRYHGLRKCIDGHVWTSPRAVDGEKTQADRSSGWFHSLWCRRIRVASPPTLSAAMNCGEDFAREFCRSVHVTGDGVCRRTGGCLFADTISDSPRINAHGRRPRSAEWDWSTYTVDARTGCVDELDCLRNRITEYGYPMNCSYIHVVIGRDQTSQPCSAVKLENNN